MLKYTDYYWTQRTSAFNFTATAVLLSQNLKRADIGAGPVLFFNHLNQLNLIFWMYKKSHSKNM